MQPHIIIELLLTSSKDVAVLAIRSYHPSDNQLSGFQHVIHDFIRASLKQGKARITFDLRGNGGGYTILGYDLFK
jgi:C-terminal processing protease CtpA/Prc